MKNYKLSKIVVSSVMFLTAIVMLNAAEKYLWQPAPGHDNKPVIFWAHYMPMVSDGFLHCSNHAGGNIDLFPFHTQDQPAEERMYRAMKSALDSGINGFQFLTSVPPEAFVTAARIKRDTGKMFYIALEGCGMGDDVKKAAQKMVEFAKKHKDNPHVFSIDDKQVMFFYSQGKWSGDKGWQDSSRVPEARKIMKEAGVELNLIPTVANYSKILFDQEDKLYRELQPFQKSDYGTGRWLNETNWDGVTSLNGGSNIRSNQLKALKQKLASLNKPFLLVPSIRTMYDSSNRWWQAIHCRGLGVRVIRRDLKLWLQEGFRLFTFSTWNDMMETMLMPSSRNPWGLNELINYYHSLAATGKSPFDKPRFIVSYEPEVLLGDQGFFQFLVLPEKECHSSDYTIRVSMKGIDGKELYSFGNIAQVDDQRQDCLTEVRYDTTNINDDYMVMVPYVTIKQIDKSSGASRMIYDAVRLAPIRIRYNKLHYYTPYTIAMNHVNPDSTLTLTWAKQDKPVINGKIGEIKAVDLAVNSKSPFKRINLNESSLSLGAFRADDLPGADTAFFIRLTSSKEIRSALTVEGGQVESVYHAHWDFKKALRTFNKERAMFNISYANHLPTVARVIGTENSCLKLRLAGMTKPILNMSIRELADKPLRKTVVIDNQRIVIDVRLTTDATDANIDYPLPAKGNYERTFALQKGLGNLRIFHVWGLDASNRISYSNPLALTLDGSAKRRPVTYIRSGGVFDDFVNDASPKAQNPFTAKDVQTATLPTWMIPYVLLDFDEGCGKHVNHNGTADQLGRGWLEGNCQWVKEGWQGAALRINDGCLKLRSKTMPHGSLTVSMRVKFDDVPATERVLFEDGDNWQMKFSGPLSLRLDETGRVIAHRVCAGKEAVVRSAEPLGKGWNHLVVVYDLKTLALYINGKLSDSKNTIKPTYQRTHSTPKCGISKLTGKDNGKALTFAGELDQLEIIGTALTANEVEQLYTNGTWVK